MIGLKVGGVPEHFNLPWRLAIEEGRFKNMGLELFWSDMTGGTGQMIRGFQNDSIDVAVILTEGITKAILEGLDVKVIEVYVTSPLRWGIHVPYHSDITKVDQLEGQTFAISRKGSGSELMAHVLADREGWDNSDLKFNIIGDVYGGLWALENDKAQCFLWEKYTTSPFCEQKKCRYIDEVVTPWPSFVIVAKTAVYEKHKAELDEMCRIVNERAQEVKENPSSSGIISWRYNLREGHVKNWLIETDWNYEGKDFHTEFEKTVNYLKRMNLITLDQAQDWEKKLFL